MAERKARGKRKQPAGSPSAPPSFSDPKTCIAGLSPIELESKKTIILCELAQGFNRTDAAKMAGFSNREFRLLLMDDEEFRDKVVTIKKGNDDEMADMARANLIELLRWRDPKSGKPDLVSALYTDKSRGGYSERKHITHKTDDKPVDPVDTSQFDKPKSISDKISLKPKPETPSEPPLSPMEDYEGDPKELDFLN